MPRQFTQRAFEKILKRNGFTFIRTSGDHNIWKRGASTVVIQKHPNVMVCRRLIKENCLVV